MSGKPVIVIGHAALDSVYRIAEFPVEPTKVRSLEHVVSGGGMAANAAAAIARLGGQADLWSRIGSDPTGADILRILAEAGVGTRHVHIHEGARSSTAAVIVDGHGERLIVGERDHAMPSRVDLLPLGDVAAAGAVLSDNTWREATVAALEKARAAGVPGILDVDVGAAAVPDSVLALASHVICSAPALDERFPGDDPSHALARLLSLGPAYAGVTLGSRGYCWMVRDSTVQHHPAFDVEMVDSTGAGDAFHGAFAWGIAQGLQDAEAARVASAAAALSCRALGARAGLPDRAELDQFLLKETGRGLAPAL